MIWKAWLMCLRWATQGTVICNIKYIISSAVHKCFCLTSHTCFAILKNTDLLSHVCSTVPVVKPYQCDTCDYSCNMAYILKKQQQQHSGERPYSCRQCPYHSIALALLKQHMEAHESLTAVTCPHCLIVWGSPKALVLHKNHLKKN